MKIIRPARRVQIVEYRLGFRYADAEPGCGFGFDCDEQGNVDTAKLQPAARESLRECLNGEVTLAQTDGTFQTRRMVAEGVTKYERSYTEPAVGICCCRRKLDLYGFTNTCDCGRDYNFAGQELAPRSQWGEETGESLSDILSIQ